MSEMISRRSALIGLAAATASPLAFAKRFQDKPVGWAVLGLGGYATNQIMPNFAHCEKSVLVALISGHQEKLDRYGDQYKIAKESRYTYETMEKIAQNPEIDVVYVITPPSTHADFAVRAAGLGKHVCSEKPMAPTVEDCNRMIEASQKAGKLLQIGYRCHYEAHNLKAIHSCRTGELGKIQSLRSDHGFSIGTGLWRTQKALAGGGSMMDIGIYSLNALRYLSGQEPTEVEAKITNPPNDPRFVDVEDTVDFKLKFPSGLIGHGTSGYSWTGGKNQYEVVCDNGTLVAQPATSYEGNRLTFNDMEITVPAQNQFAAQIDHMSNCAIHGGTLKTPGEEGLKDIRIIQAIYESARTGKPVKI